MSGACARYRRWCVPVNAYVRYDYETQTDTVAFRTQQTTRFLFSVRPSNSNNLPPLLH